MLLKHVYDSCIQATLRRKKKFAKYANDCEIYIHWTECNGTKRNGRNL